MHISVKPIAIMALGGVMLSGAAVYGQSAVVKISNFANGTSGWSVERIDKKVKATVFSAKKIDGVSAVQAYSNNSMALLVKKTTVNLAKTPVLCWRWRVSRTMSAADITKKSGDDQAARIYIGLDLPRSAISFGTRVKLAAARSGSKTRIPDGVINYVWDNKLPVGTARPNVYTKQAKIIVMQSGNGAANKWVNERRNLAQDISRQFKTNAAKVESIAISSDTDNAGGSVTAAFADIHFTTANGKCQFS